MTNEEKNPDAGLPKTKEGSDQHEHELSDNDVEQVSGGAGKSKFDEFTIKKSTDSTTPSF